MQRFAASDLGLHPLPMSHKKDARLIWVNAPYFERVEHFFDYFHSSYKVLGIQIEE